MKLAVVYAARGAIEALKQALPADGATALRLRRSIKPLVTSLDEYQALVESKLKELQVEEVSPGDEAWPAMVEFMGSALSEEVDAVPGVLSEADLASLKVPRRDGSSTGLTVAEIDSIEALGLIKAPEEIKP